MNKILLLEDDPILGKTLKRFLEKNNFKIDWAKNGDEAIDFSYKNSYILYLFDINVPLMKGDDLLLSLREAEDKTPCILISALIEIESITKGFQNGADDYIKKPFEPAELLIRIKAKTNQLQKRIRYKDFEIFTESDKNFHNNQELYLSFTHKEILKILIFRYPNVVTKEELISLQDAQNDIALRVNITKLKQKLNLEIINIRGVGYKLA